MSSQPPHDDRDRPNSDETSSNLRDEFPVNEQQQSEAGSDEAGVGERAERTDGGGTVASAPNHWIQASWFDLILFIATPLLVVPLIFAAKTKFTVNEIYIFVAIFGATGHHLPGMMRAYGDRQLFNRFRIRFIVAPIFLLTVCIGFAYQNLEGLVVLLLLWGFWHGLMQVYGFLRIYDAKVKSLSPVTAKIDWLMCLSWFGLGLLWSPGRMEQIFREFYRAGCPLVDPQYFKWFQFGWTAMTIVVSVVFFANYVIRRNMGSAPSPIKLAAMGMSFGFWWFCMVNVKHTLLGIALFEVFHDVQYLAIVWVFNRKRAETDANAGLFTKLVFRRNRLMVLVYLAMIVAYGFIVGFVPKLVVSTEAFTASLYGLMAASTFLHFYFDGFIWKVREKSTRKSLGLNAEQGRSDRRLTFGTELTHVLKWGLFVVPAIFLFVGESRFRKESDGKLSFEHHQNLSELAPGSWRALHDFGTAWVELAQTETGLTPGDQEAYSTKTRSSFFELAIEINDELPEIYVDIGASYLAVRKFPEAKAAFETAVEESPNLAIAHNSLGKLEFQEAVTLYDIARNRGSQNRLDEANEKFERSREHYAKAVELAPDDIGALVGLAEYYQRHAEMNAQSIREFPVPDVDTESLRLAIDYYGRALKIAPKEISILEKRAATFKLQQELEKAIADYDRILEIAPNNGRIYFFRARMARAVGNNQQALADFEKAIETPELAPLAHYDLAEWRAFGPAEIRDLEAAEQHAITANNLTRLMNPEIWGMLAQVRVAREDFDGAMDAIQNAQRITDDPNIQQSLSQMLLQVQALKQARIDQNQPPVDQGQATPSNNGSNN